MMKKSCFNFLFTIILIMIIGSTISCFKPKKVEYYSDKNNYIEVTGTITHITSNEETSRLVFGLTDLSATLDDNCFCVVGDNYSIVLESIFYEEIQLGREITFITAPKYFGDGYIMPIVSLYIDDQCILEFDVGYANYLDYLESR